jgi:hypothetical protein
MSGRPALAPPRVCKLKASLAVISVGPRSQPKLFAVVGDSDFRPRIACHAGQQQGAWGCVTM